MFLKWYKKENITNISADFKLVFAVLFQYWMLVFSIILFYFSLERKNWKTLNFSLLFCPPHHVYIAIDLKTVLVAIMPHAQGIFTESDGSASCVPLTF